MVFRKVDPTGLFIEDVIRDDVPLIDTWPKDKDGNPIQPTEADHERFMPDPAYIETPVPPNAGFQWPRWNGKSWEEGGTPPAPPPPPEPTLEERNRADIDYLAMMMEVEL